MRIRNQKIEEFLIELSSKKPTPGGGAVAALSGAMAASLVEMVCNLTKGEEFNNFGTLGLARALKTQLLELADKDSEAFDLVMEAYKSKDELKIKSALQKAIDIPAETKRLAHLVWELAGIAVEKGNKNAVSDARTARHLAEAAEKSADENIKINKEALGKLHG